MERRTPAGRACDDGITMSLETSELCEACDGEPACALSLRGFDRRRAAGILARAPQPGKVGYPPA